MGLRGPPASCAHPSVELGGGALVLDQGAYAIGWVHGPTQVAVHGPVTRPPLMLVLQGRELDGLDVHAAVHQLADPAPRHERPGHHLAVPAEEEEHAIGCPG